MGLSEKLLEKLVCPTCKGKLTFKEDENRLVCDKCKVAYRVEDNIPVLLADEAEKL